MDNKDKIDRVLAIDPGKATGLAWMRQEGGVITLEETYEAVPETLIDKIRPTLETWRPTEKGQPPLRIVVEEFIINASTAQRSQEASWALRTIGAVEQALRDAEYPLGAIMWQKPAEAKNAFSNDKLKNLGLWHRGGAGHALDAVRHGSLYLTKVGYMRIAESSNTKTKQHAS